jgi:hypothetical protein
MPEAACSQHPTHRNEGRKWSLEKGRDTPLKIPFSWVVVSTKLMGDSPENSPTIFMRGGELWLMRYCWPTSFKVLGVLFLGAVSLAFLPSKKAYRVH